jgi:transposase
MRPFGSPKTLERRRRRAVALLQQGLSLREVARRVQALVSSVAQWQQTWRTGGEAALAAKAGPGRLRKLPDPQREQLLQLLLQGARFHGFPNGMWTLWRIAAMI